MKKKPETSRHVTDPDLVGSNEESSWIVGRNCVYCDSTVAKYRVSIRTPHGWKSYGHFNDLETATYIANIAILVERCEEKYELNKEIGTKDRNELDRWRRAPSHADLERTAADRYKQVQAELTALQEQERLEAARVAEERRLREVKIAEEQERQAEIAAEKRRVHDEKVRMILGLSSPALVKFIKNTKLRDPFYEIAMSEVTRRFNNRGLPRAT
ncbi:hypothetical protein [Dokdonella immobilis]|uniref:Uncharacterized protein n=1 Tax=Dokdonella immobilis TaxID=578942 RepID=A0A1I4XPQ8_9GAMM|nr:hypothetical protein [Dokdonella immobilis]SFN27260.1 hypothetical protein SAMN05216289_1112 [Dokdonella immobilis]